MGRKLFWISLKFENNLYGKRTFAETASLNFNVVTCQLYRIRTRVILSTLQQPSTKTMKSMLIIEH